MPETPQGLCRGLVVTTISRRKCKRPECRKMFAPNREWQEYCSAPCRSHHWHDENKVDRNAQRAARRRIEKG